MDLIAGRKRDGIVRGRFRYDGLPTLANKFDIAYVETYDVLIGEFTVMENLYYAAKLRLSGLSREEYFDQSRRVASLVGLEGVLDVIVGTELVKGVSGGQRKRLSVAMELLALPSAIALDEPTSGLDSSSSLQLAECLSEIACRCFLIPL